MPISIARSAEMQRAFIRAQWSLREGDKLVVDRCGGPVAVRFEGWTGSDGGIVTPTKASELYAGNIRKVNGAHQTFIDPPWEKYDPRTGRPFGNHGSANEAHLWGLEIGDRFREVDDFETFIKVWQEGSAFEEWPEFYRWLNKASPAFASVGAHF